MRHLDTQQKNLSDTNYFGLMLPLKDCLICISWECPNSNVQMTKISGTDTFFCLDVISLKFLNLLTINVFQYIALHQVQDMCDNMDTIRAGWRTRNFCNSCSKNIQKLKIASKSMTLRMTATPFIKDLKTFHAAISIC